ncbi:hypothetical protein CU663_11435 [Pseudomonas syringae pv. actinidifoliorum]|nr:hypothetical protein [Pseudomonas syringae pv. actinidifoliorum]
MIALQAITHILSLRLPADENTYAFNTCSSRRVVRSHFQRPVQQRTQRRRSGRQPRSGYSAASGRCRDR